MAVVFVQEYPIENRSTANYDTFKSMLADVPMDGLVVHTAGFDDDAGVFRILDVWESQEHADRFMERVQAVAGTELPPDVTPPSRFGYYELYDVAAP